MPIVNTDIKYRLSGGSGNTSAAASLGGAKSSTDMSTDLFDDVASGEASAGDTEYRCIYIHNAHGSLTMESAKIWIQTNTPSADTAISVGLGTSSINATEQTVADESTAPSGVTFSAPSVEGSALSLGNIPFSQHKAVWVRRVVNASSAAYTNDTFTLRVKCDTAA
jgi:hypothetical protein